MPGCLLLAVLTILTSVAWATLPAHYEVVATDPMGTGVEHLTIRRSRPAQSVHVAKIAPDAPFALRAVSASEELAQVGGLERTSSMCLRMGCLLAVNGDFWEPETNLPIGGLVSDSRLLRSPISAREQLVLAPDGRLVTGGLQLRGGLVSTDLKTLPVDAVDVPTDPDRVVLNTWAWGTSLAPDPARLDLVLHMVRPEGVLRLRRTVVVELRGMSWGTEGTAIPRDGAVLSGRGAGARRIEDLWRRVRSGAASAEALLRLESTPEAVESIGGSPVLVRDGRPAFPDVATSFVRGRHPRTIVGRSASGEALLVTVDGRQPGQSEGMSLADAAQLMIELGAVDAINLDGGGSTTFVKRGEVVNRPSDRLVERAGRQRIVPISKRGQTAIGHVERPVAVALVLVPRTEAKVAAQALLGKIELPPVVDLATPHDADQASDVSGGLPAVVASPYEPTNYVPMIAASLVALALLLLLATRVVGARGRPGVVVRPTAEAKPGAV